MILLKQIPHHGVYCPNPDLKLTSWGSNVFSTCFSHMQQRLPRFVRLKCQLSDLFQAWMHIKARIEDGYVWFFFVMEILEDFEVLWFSLRQQLSFFIG